MYKNSFPNSDLSMSIESRSFMSDMLVLSPETIAQPKDSRSLSNPWLWPPTQEWLPARAPARALAGIDAATENPSKATETRTTLEFAMGSPGIWGDPRVGGTRTDCLRTCRDGTTAADCGPPNHPLGWGVPEQG